MVVDTNNLAGIPLNSILDTLPDGILVSDKNNTILLWNSAFLELWRLPAPISKTHDLSQLLDYLVHKRFKKFPALPLKINNIKNDWSNTYREELFTLDNRIIYLHSQPQLVAGEVVGRVWSFRNITANKLHEKQLLHFASHDNLTGLPNRILLMDRIQQAIIAARRTRTYMAVLFADLNGFKNINDRNGHQIGDLVLVQVATRLRQAVRQKDTVARIGGDEFVIVLTDLHHTKNIERVVNKLLTLFTEPFSGVNYNLNISVSMGISFYPIHGEDLEILLQKADSAMYYAKSVGRNNYQLFRNDNIIS